jgi:uncharacterized protein YebE (UPF0316 family)
VSLIDAPAWILAPAIFFARIVDVSMGTLRTIFVFRGFRLWAATIGFFEILLWLSAAGQVFTNLDRWYLAVAYAGGFAAGNIVGSWIESKVAMGHELARIVSPSPTTDLAGILRTNGYDAVKLEGSDGRGGRVEVLLVVETRREMPRLLDLVHRSDPSALWTLNDVKRRPDATIPWFKRVLMREDWRRPGKRK